MHIAILGSGPVGMTAGLLLARQGHQVTLVDRDPGPVPGRQWNRVGVMQFHLPHGFRHQCRALLAERLPDVLAAVTTAGAEAAALPGSMGELATLRVRRSVFERALWECASAEPGITRLTGHVDGIDVDGDRATGVIVDSAYRSADLVVDASGRSGRLTAGFRPTGQQVECGMAYASRIYQVRPGMAGGELNGGLALVESHAGFMTFVFPHEAGTFSVLFVRPSGDKALALLRHTEAFEAACRAIPTLAEWTDPARSEPIDFVRAGAGLTNEFLPQPSVSGLVAIGDAFCTTNPAGGRGMTLGMQSAAALADLVATGADLASGMEAWGQRVLRPWFDDHLVWDASLLSLWSGERVQPDGPIGLDVLVAAAEDRHPEWWPELGRFFAMLVPPPALDPFRAEVRIMLGQGWQPPAPAGMTRDQLAMLVRDVLTRAA